MNHLIIENDNGKVYLDQHIGKLVILNKCMRHKNIPGNQYRLFILKSLLIPYSSIDNEPLFNFSDRFLLYAIFVCGFLEKESILENQITYKR